ncbi:MAG: two-component regulator propeller domain-containing protein [Bacteroidota bacterium]
MRKPILLSILLLASVWVFAQQEQIQFSRLDLSNGLSHNQVNTIFKDEKGFLWFGTLAGLNRFDGYQVKVFKHDPRDTTSLSDDCILNIYQLPDQHLYLETRSGANVYDQKKQRFIRDLKSYLKTLNINTNVIQDILKDDSGNYWFNAVRDGIFKYEPGKRRTTHFRSGGFGPHEIGKQAISSLQKDKAGQIWIIYRDKRIALLNPVTGKIHQQILAFQLNKPSEFQDFKMFIDNDGDFWIYTVNIQRGIDYYSRRTNNRRFLDKGAGALNNNLINGILQDAQGQIWIGTDHGGINLLDKKDFSVRFLTHEEDDPKSVGQNSILSLYKDPSGIIWVGTYKKGVSFYHKKILKFPLYRHRYNKPNGLTYDDINRFVEDQSGNLWIGTNGGGLFYFNRKTGQFKQYRHEQGNPNSLTNDIIVGLFIDKAQQLWIGTYLGGLDRFDGKNFKHYKHKDSDPKSLADDRVWDIMEDGKNRLWVSTLGGGLDLLDRSTGAFTHHKVGQSNSLHSNFISCAITDTKGNIWIGTSDGLDQMTSNGKFIHYQNEPGKSNSLINKVIYDLMEDSHGYIWIATRDGLSRLDPKTRSFRNFEVKDGLTEMATLKILEDNNQNIWVSTANGLFAVTVSPNKAGDFSYTFRKYDEHDGLQGSAFNANAGYKTRAGELVFGGANGFNLFQPATIKNDNSKPGIIFSDFQIANKSIGIGERLGGRVLLNKAISFTDSLKLSYDQNGFTLEFAALNFFDAQAIRYRYKLEGFDQHWQELQGNNRRATYTNIDPGNYVFKVISTNASGKWLDNAANLEISIPPPFWRTWLAYVVYALIVVITLLLIRRRGIQRIRKEFLLQQERQQARRMHELDMLKIKFFTNMSHEFRTPLSLIITPLEKLIRQAREQDKQPLIMIQRNGRRLLNLVNQLLDFRRMEVQELSLHRRPGDIVQFIRELSFSFTDEAEKKHIHFSFQTSRNSLITLFDHDKIERILFNLLSNAFKFTPEAGLVEVKLEDGQDFKHNPELILRVSDSGIGVPEDKQDKIFERFFQSITPDSIVNQGSGIGLSITKEFVKLHDGEISVKSRQGGGSVFTVVLPLPELQPAADDVVAEQISFSTEQTERDPALQTNEAPGRPGRKPVVLLVEDNDDFRFYLKDNLKEYYEIVEANNGKSGWQKVLAIQPSLVVSDVSMPGLTGTELCRKIKADKRTAAIPVILLTALIAEEQQLEGLETGASDYMTKPFNFEILLSKIKNLVAQQRISKQTYQKQLEVKPSEVVIESMDEKFIRSVSLQMEKHLADPDYSVDQLSSDMNISRVGLYKKLIQLTGKSPVLYMREYRLKKAIPLLEKSQLTISQVAYEVGFSNPKQFSKYFKQHFGVLPSAYISQSGSKK